MSSIGYLGDSKEDNNEFSGYAELELGKGLYSNSP